jgi:hypothetical protein
MLKVIVVAIEPNNREFEYTHVYWLPTRPYGGVHEYSRWLCKLKGPHLLGKILRSSALLYHEVEIIW